VRFHECLVCRGITTFGSFNEVGFVQWPVHHRRFYTGRDLAVPVGLIEGRPRTWKDAAGVEFALLSNS
jgi:hypothetical protein